MIKKIYLYTITILFSIISINVQASIDIFNKNKKTEEAKSAEEAFLFDYKKINNKEYKLNWVFDEDYYLYKERIKIKKENTLEDIIIKTRYKSKSDIKDDPFFGQVDVFHNTVEMIIEIENYTDKNYVDLIVEYQGCWSKGICYPPIEKNIRLNDITILKDKPVIIKKNVNIENTSTYGNNQDSYFEVLNNKSIYIIMITFFIAGILLSFTPCVFPMIPIISSIIIGNNKEISNKRAFYLSSLYVISMSIAYTLAGILAGVFGANIQAVLQSPIIIIIFSLFFIILALSMFGLYTLEMPKFIQGKVSEVSHKQKSGSVIGVAVMGFLSALIVGPCMAAPLAGALLYIGQTGSPYLGGLSLFSLSVGMGLPLIIIVTSANKILPKAGHWMDKVKVFFGIALILLAIYMIDRIIPTEYTMLMTSSVLIISAVYMGVFNQNNNSVIKGIGIIIFLYGVLLFIGGISGSDSFKRPLKVFTTQEEINELKYIKVKTVKEIEKEIENSSQPVILDFFAEWCVSCYELEDIFKSKEVYSLLNNVKLIKVDITDYNNESKEILKKYKVLGPPALLFYKDNYEIENFRTIGLIEKERLIDYLIEINKAS